MPKTRQKPAPAKDQRDAARSTLLLRSAKVVCQSGEYVCLVRNVSEGGVGLRFFHEVPGEPRIFLQLANGTNYPVERAWAEGHQAGYRFARPVDLGEFIDEPGLFPHRAVRINVEAPALVTALGRDSRARLIDISRCGAKVRGDQEYPVGAFVRLEVGAIPARFGHVCWRRGKDHGLVFQQALPLAELAAHVLALQPYAVQGEDDLAVRAA